MIITKTQEELWEHVLHHLKPDLKDETFDLWLKPLRAVKCEEGLFILRVPNRFFSDWIKAHYQGRIEGLLSEAAGSSLRLGFDTQADDAVVAGLYESKIFSDSKSTAVVTNKNSSSSATDESRI